MAFPTLPLTVPAPSEDLPRRRRVTQKRPEGGGIPVLEFPYGQFREPHTNIFSTTLVLRLAVFCYTGVSIQSFIFG